MRKSWFSLVLPARLCSFKNKLVITKQNIMNKHLHDLSSTLELVFGSGN